MVVDREEQKHPRDAADDATLLIRSDGVGFVRCLGQCCLCRRLRRLCFLVDYSDHLQARDAVLRQLREAHRGPVSAQSSGQAVAHQVCPVLRLQVHFDGQVFLPGGKAVL